MATQRLYVTKAAYVDQANPTTHYTANASTFYNILGYESELTDKRLYLSFQAMPSNLRYNKVTKVTFTIRCKGSNLYRTYFSINTSNDFDAGTLTYATKPDVSNSEGLTFYPSGNGDVSDQDITSDELKDYDALRIKQLQMVLDSPAFFMRFKNSAPAGGAFYARYGLIAGTNAYIEVTYDPTIKVTSQVAYKSGPASGYFNPRNAATFQWMYNAADDSFATASKTFTQSAATFYWKASGDANYTAVDISGTTTSTTIAANVFPAADTITWYVTGTDTAGTTTSTPTYSFSTAASLLNTVPTKPVNDVIDGSAESYFEWVIYSTDGQPASLTTFEWKKSTDNTWTQAFSQAATVIACYIPGGTFPAGEIDWRIIAYNIDGVIGTYTQASFICVAAPDPVSGLAATEVPLTTISWQSDGQEAYQISIDGVVVKKAFGPGVYSWTVPEPLADGTHEISVIVQGQYGFWSNPSTVTITVANTPDTTITLSGDFGIDADLSWDVSGKTYIYRDGVMIGDTTGVFFTDNRVLGSHSYYVEQWIGDGNYNRSNTVTGTMSAATKQISTLDGSSGWLELRLSENSYNTEVFNWSQKRIAQNIVGAVYPALEISTFEDLTGAFNVAFTEPGKIAQFEAMRGEVVIVKSRGGNVITGMLAQLNKKVTTFYTAYTFTIQQVHVEDYAAK